MSKNRTSWSMTLVLCVAAVLCAGGCLVLAQDSLLFYTWARPEEMDDYKPIFDKFEAETGLKVPVFKKGEKPIAAGLAMEQPLDVEITGDFDGFYTFLLALEQLPRITRISNMEIQRSKDVDGEMRAKCVLSVYYQRDTDK